MLLRVGFGCLMLFGHGLGKLKGFPKPDFSDPLGVGATASMALAIFAEVGCSVLLVLGLATRLAATPLLITMVVAWALVHAGAAWRERELAFVYGLAYLCILVAGPGRYSVDHALWGEPELPDLTAGEIITKIKRPEG